MTRPTPDPAPFLRAALTLPAPQRAPLMAAYRRARLRADIAACRACPLARSGNHGPVPFTGPTSARIVLVGEAPGGWEDRVGEPFVGPAGKLLDDILTMAGIEPGSVIKLNTVQCRPPRNRNPRAAEVGACRTWVDKVLEFVSPVVVVAVGRYAREALGAPKPNKAPTRAPGGWWLVSMVHPAAYLWRQGEGWADPREHGSVDVGLRVDREHALYRARELVREAEREPATGLELMPAPVASRSSETAHLVAHKVISRRRQPRNSYCVENLVEGTFYRTPLYGQSHAPIQGGWAWALLTRGETWCGRALLVPEVWWGLGGEAVGPWWVVEEGRKGDGVRCSECRAAT